MNWMKKSGLFATSRQVFASVNSLAVAGHYNYAESWLLPCSPPKKMPKSLLYDYSSHITKSGLKDIM